MSSRRWRLVLVLGGDSSFAGAADGVDVLGEDSALVAGFWLLDCFEAFGDLFGGDFEA